MRTRDLEAWKKEFEFYNYHLSAIALTHCDC